MFIPYADIADVEKRRHSSLSCDQPELRTGLSINEKLTATMDNFAALTLAATATRQRFPSIGLLNHVHYAPTGEVFYRRSQTRQQEVN